MNDLGQSLFLSRGNQVATAPRSEFVDPRALNAIIDRKLTVCFTNQDTP